MGLLNSDTKVGKILMSYTPVSVPKRVEAPVQAP
jgi:hypothetical protein